MGRQPKKDLNAGLNRCLRILGRNIKDLRSQKGLTQADLSERAKVSVTTLNELESRGHRDIRLSTLVSIAQAMSVTIQELFLESDLRISSADSDQLLQASEVLQRISRKIQR
jgi:transcriptional regulator with XRE-family HTH domain